MRASDAPWSTVDGPSLVLICHASLCFPPLSIGSVHDEPASTTKTQTKLA